MEWQAPSGFGLHDFALVDGDSRLSRRMFVRPKNERRGRAAPAHHRQIAILSALHRVLAHNHQNHQLIAIITCCRAANWILPTADLLDQKSPSSQPAPSRPNCAPQATRTPKTKRFFIPQRFSGTSPWETNPTPPRLPVTVILCSETTVVSFPYFSSQKSKWISFSGKGPFVW